MGYYSFYKIIKDIIHTIFGRKFFRLLLIILIIMCLCSPVFATEDSSSVVSLPSFDEYLEEYPYYIVVETPSYYFVCLTSVEMKVYYANAMICFISDFEVYSLNLRISKEDLKNGINEYTISSEKHYNSQTGANQFNISGGSVIPTILASNYDVFNFNDGTLIFESSPISGNTKSNPYFSNADDLLDYDFNNMYINMVNFGVDDVIYLHKLEVDRTFEDDTGVIYYKQSVFKLHSDSDYYGITKDLVSYYSIPRSALNLSSDKEYVFVLNDNASSINATNGLYTDDTAYDILHLEPANSVITPEKEQNDAIKGNTDAINKLENTINSNDYDENQIQIDSSLSDNIDDNSYTNFITDIINSINNAITCDWNTVETVEIPLGFVDESITWKSDLLSAHVPQPLKLIINTFWMFLFGFYIFKFSLSLVNWLKSGEILDGKGFNSDEVITSNML